MRLPPGSLQRTNSNAGFVTVFRQHRRPHRIRITTLYTLFSRSAKACVLAISNRLVPRTGTDRQIARLGWLIWSRNVGVASCRIYRAEALRRSAYGITLDSLMDTSVLRVKALPGTRVRVARTPPPDLQSGVVIQCRACKDLRLLEEYLRTSWSIPETR
jgi:hypothetical protein